jgi:N-glycosylase/DNA lyase
VEKREWLVVHVKGMSDKEATHFLRNIGMSDHLVILDRHILRNLNFHGVIDSIPPSLSRKQYREIEQKVQHFADEIAIPVAAMDLLFWSRETGFILK